MMKQIIPITRLDDPGSLIPVRAVNSQSLVVRVQDLITESGVPNSLFYKIKSCGGIHACLNYVGVVILSSVMRDNLLEKIDTTIYVDLIDGIKPDYYTTPDCSSYDLERAHSKKQISRSYEMTKQIIALCPDVIPIGQVKGADEEQIKQHYQMLHTLGIKIFIFHTGDFFRNGSDEQIQKAKYYASLIKKKDNLLLLYGFGSQKRLEEFSFADGYLTFNHYVTALNGMIFKGRKKYKYQGMHYTEAATRNLKQMHLNLIESKKQAKLFGGRKQWVVAAEPYQELIIQR